MALQTWGKIVACAARCHRPIVKGMPPPEFINSATVTVAQRLVLKGATARPVTLGVRYGLWRHPVFGPVLIDTGYGPEVLSDKNRSLPLWIYAAAIGAKRIAQNDPVAVLAARGFAPEDVRHILITHFHADHISRLKAFPAAQLHASGTGYAALRAQGAFARLRHGHFFELLPADFDTRLTPYEQAAKVSLPYELGEGCDIFGDGSVLAVDLPGHARGHFGLFWPERDLIYGADASWLSQAVSEDRPPAGPARLVYDDEVAMRLSLVRLRRAVGLGCELKLCHDPI
jgi:glyoxylase-like metal-dependent hydrolase (beta-lactamase superfamily II)